MPGSLREVRRPLRAALLLAGIALLGANLRASITAVGPLLGEIRESTGISGGLAGLLTALPIVAFAALSPLAPGLARRFGLERVLFGSLLLLAGGILLRSAPPVATLFLGTAVLGVAIAVGNVLLPGMVKRDFPNHAGLVTGVYITAMNVSAALATGLSVPLAYQAALGWRGALGCWAMLAVVAACVWLPLLRRSRRPGAGAQALRFFGLWRSPLAWQVTLFMGLQSVVFYVCITWLPDILRGYGLDAAQAGWMVSLMQFVSIPAALFVPILAGRLRSQRGLAAAAAALSGTGTLGLLLAGSTGAALWITLLGLGQGSCISLALTLFALRAPDARHAAELSGMAQAVGYALAALGPPLFGLLYDATRGWTIPLAVLLAVTVCLLFLGLGAGRNAYVTSAGAAPRSER
ncbi:CynX/NimT family MFS transporter [Rubrobacter taiwanensis]|uniref:CynX/NimT family MFS transporter n=1 Tax=Rubrobacter taiwanensis TaxID=185139 RepID=UPI001FB49EB8|nr:MFS transporter [Rubrobacter taiwanensis]